MNHRQLAELCQLSYSPNGISKSDEIGGLGVKCFVVGVQPRVVVFRGTADRVGWVQDLLAKPVAILADGQGNVHDGFLEGWQSIRKQVIARIGKGRVIMCGHSLGAAIATLAAFEQGAKEVVTFGSPRVGNGDFALDYCRRLGQVTTRYVHQLDPVPLVPGVLAGYRHVCPARWFDGTSWRATNPWTWLLAACKRGWASHEKLWLDHGIGNYVAALAQEHKR